MYTKRTHQTALHEIVILPKPCFLFWKKTRKKISDEPFKKNGFRREDILFFATMEEGDYIEVMMETSVKMFHAKDTLGEYGLTE